MAQVLNDNADDIVQGNLHNLLNKIEKLFKADVVTFVGPIDRGIDDILRTQIEQLKRRKRHLCFILETNGGYIEGKRSAFPTFSLMA